MRYTSAAVFACLLSLQSFAQGNKPVKQNFGNELGLMGEYNFGAQDYSVNSFGLQLKSWRNKYFSIRASAAYAHLQTQGSEYFVQALPNDTIVSRNVSYNLTMAQLGIGCQFERQFFGKMYLYGGADLRIGYGSGRFDTTQFKRVYNTGAFIGDKITRSPNSQGDIMINGGPFVGIDLRFRRIAIGTEFSNPFMALNSRQASGTIPGFYFTLGNINQRVYLNIRI